MPNEIKTTGHLRETLTDAMLAVKSGTMDLDSARVLVKLAAQVNESIYSEVKAQTVRSDLADVAMGELNLGSSEPA